MQQNQTEQPTERIDCPDCPLTFASWDELVDHRSDVHDAYTRATLE